MERRSEPRVEVHALVRLAILGEHPREIPAHLANISGKGVRLLSDEPVSTGAAVQLEADQMLLLGEVRSCECRETGYALEVELEHVVRHTDELARLAAKLLEFAPEKTGERTRVRARERRDRAG